MIFKKVYKTIFGNWKKYFIFVFLSVFFSLYSYTLSNNIVLSVENYLKSELKPMVWWDVVMSPRDEEDLKAENLDKYKDIFEIARTVSINSTIFDKDNKPALVNLVYSTPNYPFYNSFTYSIINSSGALIVDKKTYEKYWNTIEILWKKYAVKWVINISPLWDISLYSVSNNIYLPLEYFDTKLNSTNSRIDYDYYLKFKWNYDEKVINTLKADTSLKWFRIRSLEDRNENISNITDRFYLYINFFNLTIFVLTFFIIILSLETFFKKIKSNIWLLNIFWLNITKILFYTISILALVFLISFILSYIANFFTIEAIKTQYDFFSMHQISFIKWIIISFILLIIWVFSPFYKIYKSDLQSLLKDSSNFSNFKILDYIIYLSLIFIWFLSINLVSWIDFWYSLLYSFCLIVLIVIFYFIIDFILNFGFKLFKKDKVNFYIFDAIRSTIKPGNVSFLIIFSSIISFISIFIFYVFSDTFLSYLTNITQNSRDTFIINVQKDDLKVLDKYFIEDEVFEIVALKIKTINWKTLSGFLKTDHVSREFSREFFSTTKTLDNKILKWKKLSTGWVSVDKEFADRLWLNIWDKINFSVAGLEKNLEVVNFREAVRNWTDPFFYFMLFKWDFEKYPKNYIISYKKSAKQDDLESIISKKAWPHLTIIPASEIIKLVIEIASKILIVVYFCLFYIFIFSFLSFLVSIMFLRTFKDYKLKLLNMLWWAKKSLLKALNLEYIYLLFVWFMFSLVFWSIILFVVFYFIKFFSFNLLIYGYWVMLIFLLFLFMCLSLVLYRKK